MGVKECGRRPSRFVEPMKRISDISIRVQACPLWLWIVIICFEVKWINHCWMAIRRLLISRFVEGNSMVGNMIMRATMGSPIIVGVMKEENKFSFIWSLKGQSVLVIWFPGGWGWGEKCV